MLLCLHGDVMESRHFSQTDYFTPTFFHKSGPARLRIIHKEQHHSYKHQNRTDFLHKLHFSDLVYYQTFTTKFPRFLQAPGNTAFCSWALVNSDFSNIYSQFELKIDWTVQVWGCNVLRLCLNYRLDMKIWLPFIFFPIIDHIHVFHFYFPPKTFAPLYKMKQNPQKNYFFSPPTSNKSV